MPEKFLPIGTVVMLKGGTKRLMITGFCMMDKVHTDKMYDYCGCLYPEGMVSSNQTGLFDHSQIEKIYFLGYQDEEQKKFITTIKDLLAKNPNLLQSVAQNVPIEKKEPEFDANSVPPIGPGL